MESRALFLAAHLKLSILNFKRKIRRDHEIHLVFFL